MKYVRHPLIAPGSLEERSYQISIALKALDGNTMVVLPTGLGKTAVALLTAASRLHNRGGKILMLAPTKPLVEQHHRFFGTYLLDPGTADGAGSGCAMFTGETNVEERTRLWRETRVICATPQVVKNDCIAGRYDLADVSLLIVDECHRAVGNYSYVFLGRHYMETATAPLVLAMTASPGSNRERVDEVCEHLAIAAVESRTEDDADVRPYIHEREIQYMSVELPAALVHARDTLLALMDARLKKLSAVGYQVPPAEKLSMKALNALNASIQRRIQQRDASGYMAASVYAEIMKLRHAVSLAESQGSTALRHYLEKISSEAGSAAATKASKRLVQDIRFQQVLHAALGWEEELHPKLNLARNLVRIQLASFPESRIIIFATFRDTVQVLVDHLNAGGIECRRFVGQASRDAEKGLTQKKQLETLQQFREGAFKVLIATSVGEEGLDVPSTDMVIFYEAVPSEIRSIQRKGRTGRHGSGRIVVLVTAGTSDEAFSYVSISREKAMQSGIKSMAGAPKAPPAPQAPEGQTSIDRFVAAGPRIAADDRETSSRVVERLHAIGATLEIRRLAQGDYAVGDRILIERKTTRDFMDTLVERDLLGQIRRLADAAPRPVLIIEGADLYGQRNIHPNAVRGALAAIAVDMGVTLLYTASAEETAEMIFVLARRAEGGRTEGSAHPKKLYRSEQEQIEYILSAYPAIGPRHARLLLAHFGSLHAVITAEKEALQGVPGIGEKTARTIWELSRRTWG
ncbi:MAG TPA: DEAD/DEAH box helicase [Methanoculleus sp.]|nr:DEAD/DEAH box helicase [Methanoculleus sp.]